MAKANRIEGHTRIYRIYT